MSPRATATTAFSQANRAEAIRILRSVDMPLDEIRELLEADDPEIAHKFLSGHQMRLAERLADQERMLAFLEALIERKESVMPYEITVKEVSAQEVAALRTKVTHRTVAKEIEQGFGTVMGHVMSRAAVPSGAPFIVFHDVIDEQNPGEIEICIPLSGSVEGEGRCVRPGG